jgi:hypothetical protein
LLMRQHYRNMVEGCPLPTNKMVPLRGGAEQSTTPITRKPTSTWRCSHPVYVPSCHPDAPNEVKRFGLAAVLAMTAVTSSYA